MVISVDYSVTPWLITIPKSDLTLDTGSKYTLTVNKFWELLRDYADGAESMPNPIIYYRIPSTSSTPSITNINSLYYNLQFEDGLYSVNIIDGNTNIRVVEVKNQVSVNNNNTTGFINPTFLEFSTFGGGVHVDSDSIYSGTLYPIGTQTQKVNNFEDGKLIAQVRGFDKFSIHGNKKFNSVTDLSNFSFIGSGQTTSRFDIDSAANVYNSNFQSASITGTLDGNCHMVLCIIENLSFVNGIVENCILNPGNITLGGGNLAQFIDCKSGVPGEGSPIINCGGSGNALTLRNYSGGIELRNKTGSDAISIDLASGQVRIETASVTNGTIIVRGDGKVVNSITDDNMPSGTYGSLVLINETLTPSVVYDKLDNISINSLTKRDFLALK